MANVPTGNLPAGDLARVKSEEMSTEWPVMIEIVAYFGREGRRGKRRSVEISADEFFGRGGGFNAPMTGDQVIGIINRLRRQA